MTPLTEKRDESNRRDQHNERDDQPADSDFSAKDVWDELQTIYGPSNKQEEELPYDQRTIFEAILSGNWEEVDGLLNNRSFKVTVVDKVANNGNTALHIAVGNVTDQEFLRKLLGVTPENTQLSNVQNSDGSTLLHVAAMVGDVIVAEMLVAREAALLFTKDKKHRLPLAIALLNLDEKMSRFLKDQMIKYREWNTDVLSGISGDELLVILISSKQFEKANEWLKPLHKTRYYSDAVLMAIAQNFPSELNALEKYIDIIHRRVKGILKTASDYMKGRRSNSLFEMIIWVYVAMCISIEERARVYNDAIKLLNHVCSSIHDNYQPISEHHRYYKDPIFEATRQNAYEVVQQIVLRFPNAIWSANEDGHNIVQYAVINRSENVYNVLYQMNKHKNTYKTIKDPSQNNLLHLAARLAPASRLNLISGAALQVQHELKWFKEVKRFVSPLCITEKNSFGETPEMVFTREHKELVIEGEKWIKTTAESYTITVALITTIVFAAAITVPGGNNQDMGIPLFTNNPAFTIFAISDAISLFTAVTSLLIFLSILTTRFAQQDFLYKLPTKLMVGLVMLLTSTTAMIVAFGATLYLVFGQGNSKILIPIVVLTCLSIISFVILQFPLIRDLMTARFGRSIFGKKRDEPFY
uniref:PGG domain-containing protein n=2 Tax=Lactuca sativa TaxID=4236 RepID=A0A9R1V3M6_LACSA|nr:hypothetical protein LSAT_V11C700357630 [Lactuca sativa]KAJ0197666.1 hypothetical protein LSAT_V11C700357650 [Lactuca sativa]